MVHIYSEIKLINRDNKCWVDSRPPPAVPILTKEGRQGSRQRRLRSERDNQIQRDNMLLWGWKIEIILINSVESESKILKIFLRINYFLWSFQTVKKIIFNPGASGCINFDANPFQLIFSPTSWFSNSFILVVNF